MSAAIAYDMVRLFSGPLFPTPRGIDRVELGCARHFAQTWRGDCGGTLPTPWGVLWFDRDKVLTLIDRLEEIWLESIDAQEDAGLDEIKLRLLAPQQTAAVKRRENGVLDVARRFSSLLLADRPSRGVRPLATAPRQSIYVNIGHLGLAIPWFLSWLRRRPDIKPVFMIHDMIPIENPEWVSPASTRYHWRMTDNAARYAAALVATSRTSRDSVLRELRLRGRCDIPVATVPLPVAPIFLEKARPDPELASHSYFVVCGAIEPRKNHALIINVWRELVRRHGTQAPKLIIVGSPGWGGDAILHILTRCREIKNHVILATGLSSPALRCLMSHAKGVLMASYAEGYGLPLVEALAVGTPVIASDLPAHRDVAGDYAVYRHPIDGLGWLSAIETLADSTSEALAIRQRIANYRPPTWPEYFCKVERFLRTLY